MYRLKTNYYSLTNHQIKPSATIAYSTCYHSFLLSKFNYKYV